MTSGLVPLGETIADERLGTWASTFLQIASVSAQLARTPFVPVSLRVVGEKGVYDEQTTAANVAAAILTGQEIGLEPMAALRSINVINSTPALSALALRALAQRHGHGIWLREATNTRAIVEGLRAGEPESKLQRITWTMDDAKSRNLAGRPNWRTQPRNMLIARATSEVVRLVAADAVLGIPYSIEELEDGDEVPSVNGDAPAPDAAPRTARRRGGRAVAVAAVESAPPPPPEDEPPLDEPAAPPVVEPILDTQRKALHAGFRDLGLKRADQLKVAARVTNRTVTSSNELTKVEASKVLDEIALLKARASSQQPAETRGNPAETAAPADDEPPLDAVGPHVDEPDGGHMSGFLGDEDEPAFDEEPPASAPATTEDFAAVRVLFDVAQFPGGREGQDARVRYASNIVGRPLSGPTDLTHGEAAEVVAALRIMAEDMPPPDVGDGGAVL